MRNPKLALACVAALCSSAALARPVSLEVQALALINDARARGVRCPGGGGGVRLAPLALEPRLRTAALAHARDMGTRGYLSHFAPGGTGPKVRVVRAGYRASRMSEIIYKHSLSGGRAEAAVGWWLRSPVHCRAIMNPAYTQAGVGYYPVGKSWTAVLALPGPR